MPLFAGARQALGSSTREAGAFLEPRVRGGTWGLDQPLAQHQASLVRPCLPRSVGCLEKQQGSRIRPLINTKSLFILFYFIFRSAFLLLYKELAEDDGRGVAEVGGALHPPAEPPLLPAPQNRTVEGP